MAEPVTTLALAGTLAKLIGLGLTAYKAHESDGFDESDVGALKSLIDSGTGIFKLWSGRKQPTVGARHLALISKAFGTALRRHHPGTHTLSEAHIKYCSEQAAPGLIRPDAGRTDEKHLD